MDPELAKVTNHTQEVQVYCRDGYTHKFRRVAYMFQIVVCMACLLLEGIQPTDCYWTSDDFYDTVNLITYWSIKRSSKM
jgi:hypothetical protein